MIELWLAIERTCHDFGEDVIGTLEWLKDHVVDVSFALILLLIAVLAIILWQRMDQDRQQQLELCQRAFDYTHEQCEFIVRNRVMPR